jgi:transposase
MLSLSIALVDSVMGVERWICVGENETHGGATTDSGRRGLMMGRHASRFIRLNEDDQKWLEERWKHDASHSTRSRAHAMLLSSQRYSIIDISHILHVTYETIEAWMDRWDEHGRDGLTDNDRTGRPPALNEEDRHVLREIVQQHPQEPAVMIHQLQERTDKSVSRSTLRRTLRALGFRWKRLRRSLRKRRDPDAFGLAAEELKEIRAMPNVKLVYFDEANFSISGVVSYAWQPVGERVEIPISGGHRNSIQVLGFQSTDGTVRAYVQRSTVRGSSVVAAINDFIRTIRGTTVLVLDNASPHTCREVAQNIESWAKRGLILYRLPPYSPELNGIEHLWLKLKHQSIPAAAWEVIDKLAKGLINALKQFGTVCELEPILAL